MTSAALPTRGPMSAASESALRAAARFWFVAAVAGQWAFLYYIVVFYGPSTFSGDFQAWARNKMLIKGYAAGDTIGNLTFGAHALLAGIIAFGGALQLIPWLRARAPSLHRWNGRLFTLTALAVSVSGLYLVWIRGGNNDVVNEIGVSLNAVLIIAFVILAWRSALARAFAVHRRWALRAYIVANGQFFTRVGFLAWVIVNGGPKHLGPFFMFWSFGSYLLPLAVLELYLHAQKNPVPAGRLALAGVIVGLTLIMGVGTIGFMGMVRPLLIHA